MGSFIFLNSAKQKRFSQYQKFRNDKERENSCCVCNILTKQICTNNNNNKDEKDNKIQTIQVAAQHLTNIYDNENKIFS